MLCAIALFVALSFIFPPVSRAAGPASAGYVKPGQCAACHPNIWAAYSRTGMARSFYPIKPGNTPEDFSKDNVYYHKPSESYFTMLRREGRYYQRRHQMGPDWKPTNVVEKEVHFVVGSGRHVRTYLHRTSRGKLVELPLAWYSEDGGHWGMNPGYDRPDHQGFRRAVSYECLFCHNAYPDSVPNNDGTAAEAVYPARLPEGIDCQRCHGPGGKHVETAQTPGAKPVEIRATIVNPARLSAGRQMEVCMQCHLETTSFRLPNSIPRFDKAPFSYKPGEPLGNFVLFFDHASGSGRDDKLEIVSAVYRLRRSACFQKSAGKLLCTTCHNPHEAPRGEKAAGHFVSVCLECHSAALGRLGATGAHPQAGDCLGCHMPKRRTEDVVHAVVTDHYIQRRRPERNLLAPLAERHESGDSAYHGEVVPYYPRPFPETPENELYTALAQVIQQSNLNDGIARLSAAIEKYHPARGEFYFHLADAWRYNGRLEKALPLYEEALRRQPKSVTAMLALAQGLRLARRPERSLEILKQALRLAPDRETAWYELGMTYLDLEKVPDAIRSFQKAVELDPDMPEAHNSLGGAWLRSGEAAKAEPELRNAIRIRPDFAEAHNNLGSLFLSAGGLEQACYEFETALRYRPDYGGAQYNYGLALARLRRFDEAQLQMRKAAASSDPSVRAQAEMMLRRLESPR